MTQVSQFTLILQNQDWMPYVDIAKTRLTRNLSCRLMRTSSKHTLRLRGLRVMTHPHAQSFNRLGSRVTPDMHPEQMHQSPMMPAHKYLRSLSLHMEKIEHFQFAISATGQVRDIGIASVSRLEWGDAISAHAGFTQGRQKRLT